MHATPICRHAAPGVLPCSLCGHTLSCSLCGHPLICTFIPNLTPPQPPTPAPTPHLTSPTAGVLHEEPSLCLVKVKLLKVEGLAHLYRNQPAVTGAAATAPQAVQQREASMQRDGSRDGSSPPKGGIAGIAAGLAGGKGGVLLNRTAQWLRNRKSKGSQAAGAQQWEAALCGAVRWGMDSRARK